MKHLPALLCLTLALVAAAGPLPASDCGVYTQRYIPARKTVTYYEPQYQTTPYSPVKFEFFGIPTFNAFWDPRAAVPAPAPVPAAPAQPAAPAGQEKPPGNDVVIEAIKKLDGNIKTLDENVRQLHERVLKLEGGPSQEPAPPAKPAQPMPGAPDPFNPGPQGKPQPQTKLLPASYLKLSEQLGCADCHDYQKRKGDWVQFAAGTPLTLSRVQRDLVIRKVLSGDMPPKVKLDARQRQAYASAVREAFP